MYPPVQDAGNSDSVSTYIKQSNEDIDYYYSTGSFKQVAMNTEVAGATVTNLVGMILISILQNDINITSGH